MLGAEFFSWGSPTSSCFRIDQSKPQIKKMTAQPVLQSVLKQVENIKYGFALFISTGHSLLINLFSDLMSFRDSLGISFSLVGPPNASVSGAC
jgi:hypothetical protein